MSSSEKFFTIKSAQGDYQVHFFESLSETAQEISTYKPKGFLIDKKVFGLYEKKILNLIGTTPYLLIDATEENKSLIGVQLLGTWMQEQNFIRSSILGVIGGGITQEIGAFTSHIYYRGLKWIFYPTTLLSMSDSCIGAKCTINFNQFKNQLGAFHSPQRVLICREFIDTLDDLDVRSGYGEILKLTLTSGNWDLFNLLEKALNSHGLRNSQLLFLLKESLKIKKNVVEIDEYENDLRRILNYGHTFGHALESLTNHEIPHGLGVCWGLDLINFISLKKGYYTQSNFEKVRNLIKKHLPFKLSKQISHEALLGAIRRDKKAESSGVNLILVDNQPKLNIVKIPFDDSLVTLVKSYLEDFNIYK